MPITEADELAWLPFVLQTSDALFPTGAYAHSLGFEEAVRLGMVRDEETLQGFLRDQIVPSLEAFELPMLGKTIRAALDHDLNALIVIDAELNAWKLPREIREASRQLGVRRLKALRTICNEPLLQNVELQVNRGVITGHHLVVCGVQAALENIPEAAALFAYFYQTISAICSAALKLLRIGQDGCQRVLRAIVGQAKDALIAAHRVEQPAWFNPLLEIAAMRHERAEERLFIS